MKKPAFTLLELLIVITIIGVLTSFLVLNFVGVKQRQELSLMADQAVASLQQARSEVSSGKVRTELASDGTESVYYLCEGAFFEVGRAPLFARADYDETAQNCDAASFVAEHYGLSTGDAHVDEISLDGLNVDGAWIFYSPPDGDLVFFNEEGTLQAGGDAFVHFNHAAAQDLDLSITASSATQLVTLSLGSDEE